MKKELFEQINLNLINSLKKKLHELDEMEQKYHGIVNNIDTGISLIGPSLELLFANRQIKEWFPHINPEEKPLCHHALEMHPRHEPCPSCPVQKSFEDGQVHRISIVKQTYQGIKYFDIITYPVKEKTGEITSVIEMLEETPPKENKKDL